LLRGWGKTGRCGSGRQASSKQADGLITPRAEQPGSLPLGKVLLASGGAPPQLWTCEGMQLYLHINSLYRSVSIPWLTDEKQPAKVTQADRDRGGLLIVLELAVIFEAGRGPELAHVHLRMVCWCSYCPAANKHGRRGFLLFLPFFMKGRPRARGLGMTPSSLALCLLFDF
jgi:hypothetical protein